MPETMLKEAVGKAEKKEPIKMEMQRTIGSQQISIELENKPKEAAEYAKRYNDLVSDITGILKGEGIGIVKRVLKDIDIVKKIKLRGKGEEERFFIDVWGVINSNVKIGEPRGACLFEAIEQGKWDCDNLSYLVIDVGRALGIELEGVAVPHHMLVGGKKFCFETTAGKYYPNEELLRYYRRIYARFTKNDDKKLTSFAYVFRSQRYLREAELGNVSRNIGKVIWNLNKAIQLCPEIPDFYFLRSECYTLLGRYKEALRDANKAIKMDPECGEAYEARGKAYESMGEYKKAEEDLEQAAFLKLFAAISSLGTAMDITRKR
jgi:hypothetical protein